MTLPTEMKSIAYRRSLPIDDDRSLLDIEVPVPTPRAGDLLVKVEAISVNPVDTKVRRGVDPRGTPKILGWDVAGTVVTTGDGVSRFGIGDDVYYCGAIDRPGANCEYHVVDERLVGHKPVSLSFAEAAALPLTTLTAWESLFERLGLRIGKPLRGPVVLITSAAGGVGSIALQLARRLTSATLIGTASRWETAQWALQMGAHHVVDHRKPLVEQVRTIAPSGVDRVLSIGHTDKHFVAFTDLVVPYGRITVLDEPEDFDLMALKDKSISWHWQNVFTRPVEQTADLAAHGDILKEVARLLDAGLLTSTVTQDLGPINASNLRRAHRLLESGTTIGKVVLSNF
jgi:zinc-binding alcohol dehydrogenase family protein